MHTKEAVTSGEIAQKYRRFISLSSILHKTQSGDLPHCGIMSRLKTGGRAYLYDPKVVREWMKNYKKKRVRGKGVRREPARRYDCLNYSKCLGKALKHNICGGKRRFSVFPGCTQCGRYQLEPEEGLQERLEFAMCCRQLWLAVGEIPEDEAIL